MNRCIVLLALLMVICCRAQVTINWTPQQVIDCYGAASAFSEVATYNDWISKGSSFWFNTLGISCIRAMMVPSNTDCNTNSGQASGFILDSAGNFCPASSGATILNTELEIAEQATANNVRILATPWTPPAAMKNNSSIEGGSITSGNYQNWANYMADFCTLMQSNNAPVAVISVQNEPDASGSYPTALWTAAQIDAFVPYLHSALATACPSVQITVAEQAGGSGANFGSDFNLADTVMGDSNAAYIGILSAHGYTVPVNGTGTINAPSVTGTTTQHVWETGASTGDTYNGTIANGLLWAVPWCDFQINAETNAVFWWGMDGVGGSNYDQGDNEYLTDINGNVAKRAYVFAQWSHFVRPGWFSLGGTTTGNLCISSFKQSTSGAFAIIVVNTGAAVSNQVLDFNGFTCETTITVWQTDSSNSLTQQASIIGGGSSITYTIPTDAVLTFYGHADGYRLGQLAAKVQ